MMHKYQNIPGWFRFQQTYDQVVEHIPNDGVIVEIGPFMGQSTSYLATSLWNADKPEVKIHVIDTFEGTPSEHSHLKMPKNFKDIFKQNLNFFVNREIVTIHEGRSDDQSIINKFADESVFAVMIDGDHNYEPVKDDVINWYPKVTKDGVLMGDDFYMKSVEQGMKDGLKSHGVNEYSVMSSQESTWYVTKDLENASKYVKQVPGQNCLV